MNNIQVFNFRGSGVRIQRDENGEPWFVAKDVSDVLDYSDTSAMTRRLDDDEKTTLQVSQDGSNYKTNITLINESGLYSAILGSTKPEARAFKKWVTGEVLPAIRRTGGYMAAKSDETPEEIMARALIIAQDTLKRQEAKLAEQEARIAEQSRQIAEKTEELAAAAPKAAFVDNFCVSTGTILVRDFAKHIAQALGLKGFGEKALFAFLKGNGYLNVNRYPTQYAVELGLFKVYEGIHQYNDGSTGVHYCSRITTRGQTYFYTKIKAQYAANGRWW